MGGEGEKGMGKQILVIADDEELLEFMQAALEQEGYEVQASRTGRCLATPQT
jgi:DNA-binding response OmpR family regulator